MLGLIQGALYSCGLLTTPSWDHGSQVLCLRSKTSLLELTSGSHWSRQDPCLQNEIIKDIWGHTFHALRVPGWCEFDKLFRNMNVWCWLVGAGNSEARHSLEGDRTLKLWAGNPFHDLKIWKYSETHHFKDLEMVLSLDYVCIICNVWRSVSCLPFSPLSVCTRAALLCCMPRIFKWAPQCCIDVLN